MGCCLASRTPVVYAPYLRTIALTSSRHQTTFCESVTLATLYDVLHAHVGAIGSSGY
jgi:hypothetical protein